METILFERIRSRDLKSMQRIMYVNKLSKHRLLNIGNYHCITHAGTNLVREAERQARELSMYNELICLIGF